MSAIITTPSQEAPHNHKKVEWLTVYLQPFFYGAITRLPFIYFVIHMRFAFDLGWNRIGLFVGSYQAMRVVTSIATIFTPRLAHVVGTTVALAGNILVLTSEETDQNRIILGTILVGAAETLAAMQTYVKRHFGSDMDGLECKLKIQYAAVMVGVTVAFSFGGFLYQYFAMKGVALFGAILAIMELLSFFAFLILDDNNSNLSETEQKKNGTKLDPTTHSDESSNHDSTADVEAVVQIKEVNSNSDQEVAENSTDESPSPEDAITQALDSFSESGMGANYLSYALCITFGMEAITIGYNLAVSPVYILEVFDKNTTVIGILLAAGAGFGTMVSIVLALSKCGKDTMEKYLPSPSNFLVAMCGISFAVLVAAVPVFPVHVIGLLLLMGSNDLAALLLNEMQGAITSTKAYSTLGPMGQIIRRSGNVLTAVTGPIFFGILPQLPYIVAGSITSFWTIVIALVIRHRIRTIQQQIVQDGKVDPSVSSFFASASFTRREVLARQVSKSNI